MRNENSTEIHHRPLRKFNIWGLAYVAQFSILNANSEGMSDACDFRECRAYGKSS
jgi:hypothetical protein